MRRQRRDEDEDGFSDDVASVADVTAGSTVFAKAPTTSTEMVYNDATRTMTTTTGTGAVKITCDMVYDANGNPAATSCQPPGGTPGSMSKSKTETTGTHSICR